jgi:hypothetical protein
MVVYLSQHGYGGASKFRKDFAFRLGGYEGSLSGVGKVLMADPMVDIASIIATSSSAEFRFDSLQLEDLSRSIQNQDLFGRLPFDIMDILAANLATADICSLRLASREAVNSCSPMALSQPFWRSRFILEREMDFFLAGQSDSLLARRAKVDWRKLYVFLRQSLKNNSAQPGIRNKRRIWDGLRDFCLTLVPLLDPSTQEKISGTAHLQRAMIPGPSC